MATRTIVCPPYHSFYTAATLCLSYMHSHFNYIFMYILPQLARLTMPVFSLALATVYSLATVIASLLLFFTVFLLLFLFIYLSIVHPIPIFLLKKLHCWLGPVRKHFTVVFGARDK